jgi:hypothetical protein
VQLIQEAAENAARELAPESRRNSGE